MWLKPHDMAKFGLLFLQRGQWEGKQILSEEWINDSVTAHAVPKRYRYIYNQDMKIDYMVSGSNWVASNLLRPFADGYGYQWWLDKDGMYAAIGTGGQYIMVVPREQLVVVVTSKLTGMDVFLPATLLDKYILPAIQADEAIAANETAREQLALLTTPPELVSEPMPLEPLPDIGLAISGLTYDIEANPLKYDNFKLDFDVAHDYADFSYTAKEEDVVSYQVGLDNVYRISETERGSYAARGSWESPETFVIDYEQIGYSTRSTWRLTFARGGIVVEEVGVVGVQSYVGKAVDLNH